jgi:shikimate kinase
MYEDKYMDTPIFIIGYRAVGKTTIGKKLADRLACSFVDTDQLIIRKKGLSIRSIVEREGWDAFRRLEQQVLADLSRCRNCVVATGGGAILHREQWRELRRDSLVVLLTASPEILIDRLARDSGTVDNRPSLQGNNVCSEVRTVLAEREPLYRETAHLIIDTGSSAPEEIIEFILQAYDRRREREKR